MIVLSAPGVASTACSISAQNAAATAVLSAVVNQTTANGGAVSCAVGGAANGRRAMQAAPTAAECAFTASPSYVTYLVPVIVPPAGSATTALAAINSLTEANFNAVLAANAAASGCNQTSFRFQNTRTTAACGTGATNATMCALPGSSAAAANVGAIVGGVIGGFAAFALFVALVLAARGACACCGEGCPRKQAPLADDGLAALPAAPALP